MKKIIILVICLLCLVGCSCGLNSASGTVKKYLNNYRDYSNSVEENLDDTINELGLTDEQKETYKEVFKKQYKNMKYTIEKESYDGDKAVVEVKITVNDLYAAQKDAENYMNSHPEEFKNNNVYDTKKFMDYKLDKMKEQDETIEYVLSINVEKKDNKWQVIQLIDEDIDKINGVYKY